jgi:hypothetical protein
MSGRTLRGRFFLQKGLLLLMFTLPYMPSLIAQNQKKSISDYVNYQRSAYASVSDDFIIVDDTLAQNGDLLYKRRIMPGYYVIRLSDHFNSTEFHPVGVANFSWKVSPTLRNRNTGEVRSHFPGRRNRFVISTFNVPELKNYLSTEGISVEQVIERYGVVMVVSNEKKDIEKIIRHPSVSFVDIARKEPVEETLNSFQDLSPNYINAVHALFPEVNGSAIKVSIRERTVEKSDIDLKQRIIDSPLEDELISFHANQMATVIAGGGNSAEESKGIVWGAEVSSSSFNSPLPDPDEYFNDFGISVQNHSYGFDIENYYGAEARAFDIQCNENETLIHVFSSGNKGEEISADGLYEGLAGFANLSGNMKMSKNSIVVSAHYDDYSIDSRNSRGPTHDGRIKPELTAFGPEGTSDAAAYVSGIASLLQQRHLDVYGSMPSSSLLRLALTSTADDIGPPNVDFVSGFGSVNAIKAFQLISNNQFFEGELVPDDVHQFKITVPENISNLRVGLSWNDPAAEAGSPTALVHDLDVSIKHEGTGKIYMPWVLNSFPHIDSLSQVATRGRDSLNNIEVISIEDPAAGDYQIDVSAFSITDAQKYSVVYWLDTAEVFTWTYPLKNDSEISGADIKIRWNTTFKEQAQLSVRVNSGDYQLITADMNLQDRFFVWKLPAGTNFVNFKTTISGREFVSDTLLISPVQNFSVGYNCDEGGMLQWTRESDVDSFVLYNLGELYLAPIYSGNDTAFFFDESIASEFFALAPVIDGKTGKRSLTYSYKSTGVSCYYRLFDAQVDNGNGLLNLELSTVYNVRKIVFEKKVGNTYTFVGELPVSKDLQYVVFDENLLPGFTTYRASIYLEDGSVVLTNEDVLVFADENTYTVFPNPVSAPSGLYILTDGQDLLFELIDTQGKVVRSTPVGGTIFEMNVSHIVPGLYLYRFTRGSSIAASGKVVIQ